MNKTIAVGYISRLLSVASGVLILPLIMNDLTNEQFTVWMVFTAAYMFQNVLDFGFCSSFTRYFSYAVSGRKKLILGELSRESGKIDESFFSELLTLSKMIYAILSILCIFICVLFYYSYIATLEVKLNLNLHTSWSVMSLAIIVQVYFLYLNSLFQGVGRVYDIQLASIISNVVFLVFGFILIKADLNILGLCIARLISTLSYRIIFLYYMKVSKLVEFKINWIYPKKDDAKVVFFQSIKSGISSAGLYFNGRGMIFLSSLYLSANDSSAFTLVSTIFLTILSLAMVSNNMYLQKMYEYSSRGDVVQLQNIIKKVFILGSLTIIIPSIIFLFSKEIIYDFIESKVPTPSITLIFCFMVYAVLEFIYQLSINIQVSINNLRYVYTLVISCFMSLCMVWLFFVVLDYNQYYYILLSFIISQALFNYWYWPFKSYKILVNKNEYSI
ncbi:oligosaccharide flippase family protein [Vibrio mimicus]